MATQRPYEVLAWVTSDEGLALLQRTTERLETQDALTVGTALRRAGLPPGRAAAMTGLASVRLRARDRYDDADRLVFTSELLQQASHPAVAAHRARRFAGGGTVADLCCGAGGDALALRGSGAQVIAIDIDPGACLLAAHNLASRGHPRWVVNADAVTGPVTSGLLVHADPARRRGGRRLRSLGDYRPSVPALTPVLDRASGGGLTVSPGVDLRDPDLPTGGELEFVQIGGQLVEAVVWLGDLRRAGCRATATLIGADGGTSVSLSRQGPTEELRVGPVGAWLVEPSAAVVRARLHDQLGGEIGARRLAVTRALLTTDDRPPGSPLYRTWRVEAVLPARPKEVRAWLRDADERPLEIAVHGLDVDPERFVRALGPQLRGPDGRRVHLVRLDDGAAAYVTCAG
ncbi:MAG: hypothetical protein KY437_05235 [Actinobacteria bacterium]|nr:hypothetical protein [Actinomycetota bacterium]